MIFYGILGVIDFVMIFIPIPLYYAIEHIRNPTFVTVPPIENQRLKCESPIEARLYGALTTQGYYVQTQVPCGKYRIDIALTQYKLAIECDGKAYHSSPKQKAHDRMKDKYLRKNGWKVLRFSGRQIYREMPKVIRRIEDNLF
ncbi:endonuclease domain-containing protein [Fredinandcohnia humi]